MEKKRNLWVIPTDKPSRLKSNKNVFDYSPAMMFIQEKDWKNQNIYITSDEEIKEGDWCYFKEDNLITKTKTKLYVMLANSFKTDKKIILTTDQDLIKDGVQAIPDEFLEWFVKNPSCESVEVEYGDDGNGYQVIIPKENKIYRECPNGCRGKLSYLTKDECLCSCGTKWNIKTNKIIIPKEEPCDNCNNDVCCCIIKEEPKQETLEEAMVDYSNDATQQLAFLNGAKWQAERSYSEEEVEDLIQFLSMNEDFNNYSSISIHTAKYFLEQFKKK